MERLVFGEWDGSNELVVCSPNRSALPPLHLSCWSVKLRKSWEALRALKQPRCLSNLLFLSGFDHAANILNYQEGRAGKTRENKTNKETPDFQPRVRNIFSFQQRPWNTQWRADLANGPSFAKHRREINRNNKLVHVLGSSTEKAML